MEWTDNQIKIHDGFKDTSYGSDSWHASKVRVFEGYLRGLAPPADTLIDIGCFNGALTERLRPFARRIIGIDVHAEALEEARKRGIETICCDIANGRPTALPDGTADVIVCADVVEHLLDPRLVMTEARRLLKPGGRMFLSTPNMGYWLSRLRLLVGLPPLCTNGVAPGFRSNHWVDPSHIHVSLLDEWLAFFHECGWQVDDVRGSHLRFGGRRRALAHALDAVCDRFLPALSLVPVISLRPVAS